MPRWLQEPSNQMDQIWSNGFHYGNTCHPSSMKLRYPSRTSQKTVAIPDALNQKEAFHGLGTLTLCETNVAIGNPSSNALFFLGSSFVARPRSLSSCFFNMTPTRTAIPEPNKKKEGSCLYASFPWTMWEKQTCSHWRFFNKKSHQNSPKIIPSQVIFFWFLFNHHDFKTWQKINHPHPPGGIPVDSPTKNDHPLPPWPHLPTATPRMTPGMNPRTTESWLASWHLRHRELRILVNTSSGKRFFGWRPETGRRSHAVML